MTSDLSTVNTALIVLAVVAVTQFLVIVSAMIVEYRAIQQTLQTFQQEVRPVLARLSRAAEEVEEAAKSVGNGGEDVRRALSSVRSAASAITPMITPKVWVAAQLGTALFRAFRARRAKTA
jgi:F0F1-type ATP synthase membrane subunit b/b'